LRLVVKVLCQPQSLHESLGSTSGRGSADCVMGHCCAISNDGCLWTFFPIAQSKPLRPGSRSTPALK
jgi:hypothetical protein